MPDHRMQHEDGPTWCKDCGTFDYACQGTQCQSAGSGDFDQDTERGAIRIAEEILGMFGIKKPDDDARCRAGQEELPL